MRILIVADGFPPMRSSCAVQVRDLALEMVRQGHDVTILTPDASITSPIVSEEYRGARVLRIKSLKIKDVGRASRALNEFFTPFIMWSTFKSSSYININWEFVVWYSPTIFFGPLIYKIKRRFKSKTYLILRDIFPEWAHDIGIMRKGFSYWVLRAVALFQYSLADTIGVQSPGNISYFRDGFLGLHKKIEVLNNWLSNIGEVTPCSIRLQETSLANKIIFVYAGNMGVAQGLDTLIEMIDQLKEVSDVGFVLVGRGTEFINLKSMINKLELKNVIMYEEIDSEQIPGLYKQCDVGLVWLDQRHKTHNIPGKFLSYMQAGMPVLANINPGNDLEILIRENDVGEVCVSNSALERFNCATALIKKIRNGLVSEQKSLNLFSNEYSVSGAARQIIEALQKAQ